MIGDLKLDVLRQNSGVWVSNSKYKLLNDCTDFHTDFLAETYFVLVVVDVTTIF